VLRRSDGLPVTTASLAYSSLNQLIWLPVSDGKRQSGLCAHWSMRRTISFTAAGARPSCLRARHAYISASATFESSDMCPLSPEKTSVDQQTAGRWTFVFLPVGPHAGEWVRRSTSVRARASRRDAPSWFFSAATEWTSKSCAL
jgi:hypothetical protein